MEQYFLFGKAGSGKDTVCDLLSPYSITSLALADPIREEYRRFIDRNAKVYDREKMIEIGQTYKNIYGEDIWCKEVMKIIHEIKTIDNTRQTVLNGIVVRDGRYNHEYDFFVVRRGFIPIRLIADDEVRLERLRKRDKDMQLEALKFENEHFISDDRYAIPLENNGSITDLLHQINKLFR